MTKRNIFAQTLVARKKNQYRNFDMREGVCKDFNQN